MRSLRIKVGSGISKILDNITPEEVRTLSDKLSFLIQGARFSDAYIKGKWDGRKRLFSSATYSFPTGLMGDVIACLKNYQIKLIEDLDVPEREFDYSFDFPHSVRDYQKKAVESLKGAQRGIMVMGTGGGKTVCALKVIQELGVKALFLVNTKEALYDTVRTAESCFPLSKVGVIGDGKNKPGELVTISTVASMYRLVKDDKIQKSIFDLVIVDEIHHTGADSWVLVLKHFDAFYKFGMTGTPFRTDGSSLMLRAMTGPICFNMPSIELQEKGHLAKSKVYFLHCDKPIYLDRPLEYTELYDEGIIHNDFRNQMIYDLVKLFLGKSMLIVFEKLEHGDILFEQIKVLDPNAVLIKGKTKKRDEIKLKFESGEIRTAVVSRVYNESVDIPILEVVINAAGGKSGWQVIQRIGRSLRNFKGKGHAIIIDFLDTFNINLEGHSKERMRWVKKEKHNMKIVKSIKEVDHEEKNISKGVEVDKRLLAKPTRKKAGSVPRDGDKGRKKDI